MSLITFTEAYSLECGIEVEGFVKSMSKPVWAFIKNLDDYKIVCNAKLTDGHGNIINIVFWGNDVSKVRNNLKIRITDAKWDTNKKVLHKTRLGKIIVLGLLTPEVPIIHRAVQTDCGTKLNRRKNRSISSTLYKIHLVGYLRP